HLTGDPGVVPGGQGPHVTCFSAIQIAQNTLEDPAALVHAEHPLLILQIHPLVQFFADGIQQWQLLWALDRSVAVADWLVGGPSDRLFLHDLLLTFRGCKNRKPRRLKQPGSGREVAPVAQWLPGPDRK